MPEQPRRMSIAFTGTAFEQKRRMRRITANGKK
jgi:hypothetical protein